METLESIQVAPEQTREGVQMRVTTMLVCTLLSVALAGGCATRYQQPEVSAPHGTLVFPSQEEQRTTGVFMEPMEFNGVLRPRYWVTHEEFRVPPGELRLLIRAARSNKQGRCLLSFPVAVGRTYELDARHDEDAFTIRAMHHGEAVAECEGPQTILPTPQRIPGVIPAPWSQSGQP
jgi:hypothetical protein